MKNYKLGMVEELFISKEDIKDRLSQSEIVVDENGVFIDKFYGKNIARSILITSLKSYEIASEKGIKLAYGQLGENILVDFSLNQLHIGERLQISDVILEITQNCTLCNHLSCLDPALPKLLEKDRGIFAKVIKGGIIKAKNRVSSIGDRNG